MQLAVYHKQLKYISNDAYLAYTPRKSFICDYIAKYSSRI